MCGYYYSHWLLNIGVLLVFAALLFAGVVFVLRRVGPKDQGGHGPDQGGGARE